MKNFPKEIFSDASSDLLTIVAVMAIILNVLIISITLFLLIRQYFFRRSAAKRMRVTQYYNDLLIDCLFSSDQSISDTCRLKGRNGKRFLYESVIYLTQNFSGEFSVKLKSFFYEMRLEKFLLRKLRSNKWWIIAQGLRESRIMGYSKAVKYADKYINAKHLELRVEAQISIIALKTKDPFEFLERLKKPFSIWARINLYQEIRSWKKKPDATGWLKVENPGVLVFALHVMTLLNQKTRIEDVEPLIRHPRSMVRAAVIWYAAMTMEKDLWIKSVMMFKTESVSVRKKIGQTCGMLPDIPISLLINWFNWEKSTIVKIELARAMLIHGQAAGINPDELGVLDSVA